MASDDGIRMAIKINWIANRQGTFVNLFLMRSHCQRIDDNEEYRRQCVSNRMWAGGGTVSARDEPNITMGCGMLPTDEFMQYMQDCGIAWEVESTWYDGCSIYITGNFKEAFMYLKLRYPEIVDKFADENRFTYSAIMQS